MRKTLPLLTVSLLLIGLVGSAFATTIIDKPTFFGSSNGSYITFSPSLLPLTFSTLYRGSDGYWNFNSTKIRTTVSMTITVFCGGNWTNYTVSGAGTQNIYNGSMPNEVWIDGVNTVQNSGWTWIPSTKTTTITSALASVSLKFDEIKFDEITLTSRIIFLFQDGESLSFYHSVYDRVFTITVTNGTWIGDNATINVDFNSDRGQIGFTANDTASLHFTIESGWVIVNGIKQDDITINSGELTSIFWQFNPPGLWLPIRPAMGIVGFAIMFIMPLFIIKKAREYEWMWVLMPGLVSLVLGYCLIVGWLWP